MSEYVGGLPILSRIWELHPVAAYFVVVAADFGMICFLMMLEGKMPWDRPLYKAFLVNDTIFIPLFVAMSVVALRSANHFDGFYAQRWFHWAVLAFGVVLSLYSEYGVVKSGYFTMSQEWSPSKLWHTIIFAVMAYWMICSLVSLVVSRGPSWAIALALVAIIGFGYTNYLDSTRYRRPYDNVHLEGKWIPWEWHERIEED